MLIKELASKLYNRRQKHPEEFPILVQHQENVRGKKVSNITYKENKGWTLNYFDQNPKKNSNPSKLLQKLHIQPKQLGWLFITKNNHKIWLARILNGTVDTIGNEELTIKNKKIS